MAGWVFRSSNGCCRCCIYIFVLP